MSPCVLRQRLECLGDAPAVVGQRLDGVAQVQAQRGQHLVVARPAGVQARRRPRRSSRSAESRAPSGRPRGRASTRPVAARVRGRDLAQAVADRLEIGSRQQLARRAASRRARSRPARRSATSRLSSAWSSPAVNCSTRASSGAPLSQRRDISRAPCSAGAQRLDVGHDQRARAFVGEDLGEQRVRRRVGDHVHAAHAAADRGLDRARLRQHAVADRAFLAQASQARDDPCTRSANADRRVARGCPAPRCRGSASPRPCAAPIAAATVSALMLSSWPEPSDDSGLTTGRKPASSSRVDHRGVDRVDVADDAVVDDPRRSRACTGGRRCALTRPASTPLMPTASMSSSRQSASIRVLIRPFSTMLVASIDCCVGDAPALHHARLDAELRGDFVELRAAAVHQHHAYAELVQDRDLFDEGPHRRRVAECAAAGLDDEDLALVHADVRGGARAARAP